MEDRARRKKAQEGKRDTEMRERPRNWEMSCSGNLEDTDDICTTQQDINNIGNLLPPVLL